MPPNNPVGVIGTDGYTPVYQPDARWTIWSLHDIYQGTLGEGKYIPKINDYVVEISTGSFYIVTDLDMVTLVPTLTPIVINQNNSTNTSLFISETIDNYRLYYDTTVYPYTLSVDALMHIYSSEATTARIYLGVEIDDTKIISQVYSNSGNFLGFDIPLQKVAFNSHDNYAIKSVPTCNTKHTLKTGDMCSVVIFSSSGKVLSKVYCVVEDMSFVPQAYAEQRYIVQIGLKSPFLDVVNDTIINYPVNLPMASFNPIGFVQYNDGSTVEYPVDGDKFSLYGLDDFVSTILGHKVPLVLSYKMGSQESGLSVVTNDNNFITRPYTLIVSNPNTSYNVKLFIYPRWVDTNTGYVYNAYLMNLDRNIHYNVTDKVSISLNSPSFNPKAYGITQRITFTIELSQVSNLFNYFIHAQVVDIILRGPASDGSIINIWEVNNTVPSSQSFYGTQLFATTDTSTRLNLTISSNIQSVEEYIEKVYRTTHPLYNVVTETQAPDPTHIEVIYGTERHIIDINDYYNPIVFNNQISNFSNVNLVFLKAVPGGYLKLSTADLTVKNV